MKHKIIFAGCGGIAFRWLDHITKRDDCEIIAIADKNLDNARAYCERYNITCNLYDNVKEALEKEKGTLLIDLTYVTVHCEVVTMALRAGYDVLGEKPMAVSVEQVNEMLKAVDETGKKYYVTGDTLYNKKVFADLPAGIDVILNLFTKEKILAELAILKDRHEVKVMIHEQYFYPDYFNYQPDFAEKLEATFAYLCENGFESTFYQNVI